MKKEINISSDKIGNIFFENELIKFTFNFKKLRGKVTLSIKSTAWDRRISKKIEQKSVGTTTKINFGKQPKGYYLLIAQIIKKGKVIANGKTSYGVIVNPKKRKVIVDSPFALDVAASWFFKSKEDLRKASRLVKLAGINCVRDRFSWSEIEPKKGKFKWGWYDVSAKIQNQLGLTIYQVFHDAPHWASEVKDPRYPPKNPKDIGEFFYHMTLHFKNVNYWEIWNEPDIEEFYLGKPEQYTALLKEAYKGIKKGNPNAKILLCSFAKAPEKFAENIFKQRIDNFFDIYNVHYYGPPNKVVSILNKHKKLMKKFNIQKPIWITEMGAKHSLNERNDKVFRKEASYLVKSYIYSLANGVERFFYFIFFDYTAEEWKNHNFGIFNKGFTPRPAYIALGNLTYLLGKGKYLSFGIVKGTHVESFLFSNRKKRVIVVWSRKQQKVFLKKIPTKVFDIVGRNIPFEKINKNKFRIIIGPEPIYIKLK